MMKCTSMKDLIFRLCTAHGTPGDEADAAQVAVQELSKYAQVQVDRNGNVIGQMGNPNGEKHIMFDAHLDQVGLIVTHIDENGFLKVASCGGIDSRVLPGSPVKIYGRQPILGVVCCMPPHLKDGDEEKSLPLDKLFIDTGLSGEKARALIAPGDRILLHSVPKELIGNRLTAAALDDRSGVAVLIRCAQLLSKADLDCRVSFVFSVQEETGAAGAKTAAYALNPDEAVMVDVSFAAQPSIPPQKCAAMGEGTMIGVSPVLSKEITETLLALAKKEEIPYQIEVMGGKTGTNADPVSVTRCGVRCGLLSIPQRYMHTPIEVVDLDDLESTAELLAVYAANGGINHG